ncbi:MAG TPA: hypothetical protein VHZ26_16390 [Caulobacteraceae bacterium]|jgi:hypothetical protein|nr:hypothetical protein [Caulobacteraceae bacterium]
MFSRHSTCRPIRSNRASAARVSAATVGAVMAGEARTARAGDAVRLKSGGVVMTAARVGHPVEQPFARCVQPDARQALCAAFVAVDALDLGSAEAFTNTDCPDARMAGGNNNNNSKRR